MLNLHIDILHRPIRLPVHLRFRPHETSLNLLLRQLLHERKEIVDRLVRVLYMDDETRTADGDGVGEGRGAGDDFFIAYADGRGVEEDLQDNGTLAQHPERRQSGRRTMQVSASDVTSTPISLNPWSSRRAIRCTSTKRGKL